MGRPKQYTQFIFDDVNDRGHKKLYGDLGLMYEIFNIFIQRRHYCRLTQQDLADKVGIKQSTLARIEAGRANPTLMTMIKLAKVLDLEIKIKDAAPAHKRLDSRHGIIYPWS